MDGGYAGRPFVEGVRALDLHTVGRLRKDAVLRFPYTGPHERRPGRKKQFDGCFDRRDPARMARTTLKKEKVDLYHGRLHSKAWQCRLQVVYVLPRGTDPQTKEGVLLYSTDTDLEPERIFRFYGARFQIEFAFRDAKQHLGLNHGQARSQARQHFHFNIVFAALFWARLQARLRAERPLGPFSLRDLKRCNFEEEIHQRIAAGSATGRNAPNSGAGRRRIPPERLWLRAPPPRNGAGRTLNAAPAPARPCDSGLKMCPNHSKWLVEEEYSDEATSLTRLWADEGTQPAAPSLMPFEVANALHRRVVRSDLSVEVAADLMQDLMSLGIVLHEKPNLHRRALELAGQLGQGAVYDAHYLALAENLGCELWTADRRFYRAAGSSVDSVRWIGEFSAPG